MSESEKFVDEVAKGRDEGDALVHETDDENNVEDKEDGEDLVEEAIMEKEDVQGDEEINMLALVPRLPANDMMKEEGIEKLNPLAIVPCTGRRVESQLFFKLKYWLTMCLMFSMFFIASCYELRSSLGYF